MKLPTESMQKPMPVSLSWGAAAAPVQAKAVATALSAPRRVRVRMGASLAADSRRSRREVSLRARQPAPWNPALIRLDFSVQDGAELDQPAGADVFGEV